MIFRTFVTNFKRYRMEKLLHYIWKHRILPLKALQTTDGQDVEIVDVGLLNPNAGPDFFNAKVRIGQTMWAGNIEIHLKSSDWYRHGHDTDEAYNNVILHVANIVDATVVTQIGKDIPQLQLDIPAGMAQSYEQLQGTEDYPRCYKIIPEIDTFTAHSWMDTLLCERMQERSTLVLHRLQELNGNWEGALFVTLARNFGFGINGDAFETWAKRIPLDKIGKHRDELFQIEAIFLGTAGLLEEGENNTDEYEKKLQKEYTYQQRLFALPSPMNKAQWKYLRLRPQNFPHIRLAELAWMYHKGRTNLSTLLDAVQKDKPLDALYATLDATTSDYWTSHIMFGKECARKQLSLSRQTKQLLIINTVMPVLYAYAVTHNNEPLRERLLDILRQLPAENNYILRQWRNCGLEATTAADSQSLIQLKRMYCDRADCLRCKFGYEFLKRKS